MVPRNILLLHKNLVRGLMVSKSTSNKEKVIKEYPNLSIWLDGNVVQGYGNLILTNDRLMFLNRVALEDWQLEKARELSSENDFNKIVEFTLKLHKKNFQIPLSSVTDIKMGIFSFFPLPRICMRIRHFTKKQNLGETSFGFRIPLLRGFVEMELPLVMLWISAIKAAKEKQQAITV
jgi:hypothetical protein